MTTDEKSVIGGIALEYTEVKRRLVALNAKLETDIQTVTSTVQALRAGHQNVVRMFENWPSAESFTELLNDIETKSKRKAALEKTMKDYGIDLSS